MESDGFGCVGRPLRHFRYLISLLVTNLFGRRGFFLSQSGRLTAGGAVLIDLSICHLHLVGPRMGLAVSIWRWMCSLLCAAVFCRVVAAISNSADNLGVPVF